MKLAVGVTVSLVAILVVAKLAFPGGSEDRVKGARERAGKRVAQMVERSGVSFPPKRLYIRAFKDEAELEVWASDGTRMPFRLIQTYSIAKLSGVLGPKRKEGDLQVPEGLYFINRFNPQSNFHLSLGINYPNASDRRRSDPDKPGGDIFIHGDKKSIGCLAMTDPKIEEIYLLALAAKPHGKIPVHIYPYRMSAKNQAVFATRYPEHVSLWKELKPFFDAFEKTKLVPNFTVASHGQYMLSK